jgi:hypothetical protein
MYVHNTQRVQLNSRGNRIVKLYLHLLRVHVIQQACLQWPLYIYIKVHM